MCIIVYKPLGANVVGKSILESCWESNSDGAGMAWYNSETELWQVRKGFMKFKPFWRAYKEQHFQPQDVVICHFRIGTSGLKDGGNTHPFPVVGDLNEMRAENFACSSILFHNGVVGRGEGDFSDTMIHVRDYVAPIIDKLGVNDKMPLIFTKLLEGASRWILTKDDKLWRFGSSWIEDDGCFFSNATYKPKTYGYTTIYTGGSWRGAAGDYHSGLKNPKWRDHKNGYANEFGRMVNGKWVHWTGNKDEDAPDFSQSADHANDDGTINFSKSRSKKEKKNKAKEVSVSTDNKSNNRGETLFCVIDADGVVQWGERSKEYLQYRGANFLVCPHCFEDKYLGPHESGFDRTICINCGAVFEDFTGEISMFDLEVYRRSSLDKITTKPTKFVKLTPQERQLIIDAETEQLIAHNLI
jgi:hypothetical protein